MTEEKIKEELKEDDAIKYTVKDGFVDDNDPKIKLAEAEIFQDIKADDYGELGMLYIHHPTVEIDSKIGIRYSEVFTHLINTSNLMTINRLTETLEKKGIWTEKDDEKIYDLEEEIQNKTITIAQLKVNYRESKEQDEKIKAEIQKLEKQRALLEIQYGELLINKTKLFDATIERKAEDEALLYKVIKCVTKEDNTPVWNTVEELKQVASLPPIKKLLTDCIQFWRGIEHPFLERLALKISGNTDIK